MQLVQRGCATRIRTVDARARLAGPAPGEQGTSPDEIVAVEHQRQAAMNVHGAQRDHQHAADVDLDWAAFFESVSLVDEVLRGDTRLRRHGLRDPRPLPVTRSRTSRAARRSEIDVARRARSKRAGPGAGPAGRRERAPDEAPATT